MNSRTSPIRETATFCRVCEPACGLIATVENGELTGLRPDKANVVTRGFACNKGLAGDEIHRDPDRVNYPMRRREDGTFERVTWDEAIGDISSRLREIIDKNGPNAFAPYIWESDGLQHPGRPRDRSAIRVNRYQTHVFVGNPGLREQVCG